LLGKKVAIVDPEIGVAIGDIDEGVVGFGFRTVDADEAEDTWSARRLGQELL